MAFAINTRDGRLSFWIEGVSNCQYHPIPDDVAAGVADGSIRWEAVVNAINKKRYMDKDFDWTSLREAEEKLNIRTSKFEFADEAAAGSGGKEPKSAITLDDVKDEKGDDAAVTANAVEGKKTTSRKPRKASEPETTPDIFDDGAPEEAK